MSRCVVIQILVLILNFVGHIPVTRVCGIVFRVDGQVCGGKFLFLVLHGRVRYLVFMVSRSLCRLFVPVISLHCRTVVGSDIVVVGIVVRTIVLGVCLSIWHRRTEHLPAMFVEKYD